MKPTLRKQWFAGITAMLLMSVPVAASATGERAFIPMGTADSVGVLDLDSHRFTSTISGTVNTHGSALTPDGRYLIVGSLTDHGDQDPPTRPEGVTADEHAAHHGGGGHDVPKMSATGRLYKVETSTGRINRVFDVPGPVHHVLVTQDGRYAISTHPMAGGISIVDLNSGEVVDMLATGPSPNYIATTADGRTIFVSNTGNGTVSEVDTRAWYVKRNLRTGGGPEHMVIAPDERQLYVNDTASGDVVALALSEGAVTARYDVGEAPHGLGLSPDGTVLFATSTGDEKIVRINLEDNDRQSIHLAPAPYHLAVTPGNSEVLVTSRGEPKLWVLDPESLDVVDDVPLQGIGHQISIGAP